MTQTSRPNGEHRDHEVHDGHRREVAARIAPTQVPARPAGEVDLMQEAAEQLEAAARGQAGVDMVRVLDGDKEVARHGRSYETGVCVENPAHIEALVEWKKSSHELKGRDRLRAAVPEIEALFEILAFRGDNLGFHTARLLRLLDTYGAEELRRATQMALEREAYSSGSIGHLLEQRRRERGLKPPMQVDLPDDPRVRDLRVTPHRLEAYDALGHDDDERNDA